MRKLVTIVALLTLMQPSPVRARETWRTIRDQIRNRLDTNSIGGTEQLASMELDYKGNHPFERRKLQFFDADLNYDPRASYEPIRIEFQTDALETLKEESELDYDVIDTIIETALFQISQAWIKHLKVFPVSGPISITDGDGNAILFVEDADLVVVVTALEFYVDENGNQLPLCPGGTLASAGPTVLDQFDRPFIGHMNICVQNLPSFPELIATGIHEVGHILGILEGLFPYFRSSETGEPLTPRPLEAREVLCVDGSTQTKLFASESTLQLRQTNQGTLYYDIVTPRVQQVIRNHYNCPTLNGARLENQPTSSSCIGSHLDERTLYNELMSPITEQTGPEILSPVTLAILEDSGWYQVDYEGARSSPFGFGSGCAFVEQDCIVDNQVPLYATGDFCDSLIPINPDTGVLDHSKIDILCDPTSVSFAFCNLLDRNDPESAPFFSGESTRYFTDHPGWESFRTQFDGCPIATLPAGNNCLDPSSVLFTQRYNGEVYGANSRCVNISPENDRKYPGCFPVECDTIKRRAIVGGFECTYDFEPVRIPDGFSAFGGTAVAFCPKLSTVCPQFFCQGGCSGRGVCNFDTNQCECTDPSNTNPICDQSGSSVATRPPSKTAEPMTTLPPTITIAPITLRPTTAAPNTPRPTTVAPITPMPTAVAPITPRPTTTSPITPIPTTNSPITPGPTTLAPTTPLPTTLAPVAPMPTTAAPTTPFPTTLAPVTPMPTTAKPSLPVTTTPSTVEPSAAPAVTPTTPPAVVYNRPAPRPLRLSERDQIRNDIFDALPATSPPQTERDRHRENIFDNLFR